MALHISTQLVDTSLNVFVIEHQIFIMNAVQHPIFHVLVRTGIDKQEAVRRALGAYSCMWRAFRQMELGFCSCKLMLA
jgi:hypothetical protein